MLLLRTSNYLIGCANAYLEASFIKVIGIIVLDTILYLYI
jgi:hypothetical protein